MTYPFVMVTWVDIEGAAGTWTAIDDVVRDAKNKCMCTTVGRIVALNSDQLVMAASSNIRGEVSDVAIIPVGAITAVDLIHTGRESSLDELAEW